MGKYFGTDGFRGEAGINLTADHAYRVSTRFLFNISFFWPCVNMAMLPNCAASAWRAAGNVVQFGTTAKCTLAIGGITQENNTRRKVGIMS